MNQRPALTLIEGGRAHARPGSPHAIALARALARQHIARIMGGGSDDSQPREFKIRDLK